MTGPWELRPAGPEDLEAVVGVYRAEQLRHLGRADVDSGRLAAGLAADPDFDPLHDQVLAQLDGRVVGSAVLRARGAMLAVDPDGDVPGLRSSLIGWIVWRADQLGRSPVRVSVPAAFVASVVELARAGFALERFYAEMVRDLVSDPPAGNVGSSLTSVPAGYRMRPIDVGADATPLYRLDQRAFGARPDFHPESLEQYVAVHLRADDIAPEWSLLVEAEDGELAASLLGARRAEAQGYVAVVAVDPDHQRRGLARALLLSAFSRMAAAGMSSAFLHVASDNPRALDLYRGVGMRERERIEDYVRAAG